MPIRYLTYQQIDRVKWDRCVLESSNGLIYSTAAYLHHMAANWGALVLDDYAAVMPLPWKSKWGIRYIYPPAFTQQLGISVVGEHDPQMVADFLDAIPSKFKFLEANLNAGNPVEGSFAMRKNYLLLLDKDYPTLRENYSRSARRNIARATENKVVVLEHANPANIIQMHRERFKDAIGSDGDDYARFMKLIEALRKTGHCYCIAACNAAGAMIAGSIYSIFKDRVTFLINGNTPESLANGTTHLLMDHSIQHFCGRPLFLDFEGSDNPAFARFYEQYGAKPEYYPFVRRNRLPWPLKLLKPADTDYKF